jgi:hypothetical protein
VSVGARIVGLALFAALCATVEASADTMTWRFRNQSEEPLSAQLHSRARSFVWPDAKEAWRVPANGVFYDQPISCEAGEDVCYGAWSDGKNLKWGLGPTGQDGCDSCCYRCGEGNSATVTLFIRGRARLAGVSVTADPADGALTGEAIYILSWQKSPGDEGVTVTGRLRLVSLVADKRTPRGVFAFTATCAGENPPGVEVADAAPFVPVNPAGEPPNGQKLPYDLWWAACQGQFSKF